MVWIALSIAGGWVLLISGAIWVLGKYTDRAKLVEFEAGEAQARDHEAQYDRSDSVD